MRSLCVTLALALALGAAAASAKVGDKLYIKAPEIKLRALASTSAPEAGASLKRNAVVTVLEIKPQWSKVDGGGVRGWILSAGLSDRPVEAPNTTDRRVGSSGEFGSTAGSRGLGEMGNLMKKAGEITPQAGDDMDAITAFTPSQDVRTFAKDGNLNWLGQAVQ